MYMAIVVRISDAPLKSSSFFSLGICLTWCFSDISSFFDLNTDRPFSISELWHLMLAWSLTDSSLIVIKSSAIVLFGGVDGDYDRQRALLVRRKPSSVLPLRGAFIERIINGSVSDYVRWTGTGGNDLGVSMLLFKLEQISWHGKLGLCSAWVGKREPEIILVQSVESVNGESGVVETLMCPLLVTAAVDEVWGISSSTWEYSAVPSQRYVSVTSRPLNLWKHAIGCTTHGRPMNSFSFEK